MDVYLCFPKTCSFYSLELGWKCSLGHAHVLQEVLEATHGCLFPSASLLFPAGSLGEREKKKENEKKKISRSSASFSPWLLPWRAVGVRKSTVYPLYILAYDTTLHHHHPWLCCVWESFNRFGCEKQFPCIMKSKTVACHISVDYLDSSFESSNVNLYRVSKNHLLDLILLVLAEERSMEISSVCLNKNLM